MKCIGTTLIVVSFAAVVWSRHARYLSISSLLPHLNNGTTLEVFQPAGITPEEKERLIMRVKHSEITGTPSLGKRAGILSSPVALFVFSFLNKL